MIPHPPCSPDITPGDFFLLPKVKSELAGLFLSQDSSMTRGAGIMWTIVEDEFAIAFWQWYENCNKSIRIADNYVEKT